MESFSADWLALREPADHDARAGVLSEAIAAGAIARGTTCAVDLAAGAGSNVRYLLPRLPAIRRWCLVDHDAALLAIAARSLAPAAAAAGVAIETRTADLRDVEGLPIEDGALVTASALLDLVSAAWLETLARRCRRAGADVLFALSYDGRMTCAPEDPLDARVRDLVNAHQRTDKGFGPALGPDASAAAGRAFAGWDVRTAPSDWVLGAPHGELQRQLVQGWAEAACAMAPEETDPIAAWRARRLAAIAAGTSAIRVGHQDVCAWLWDSP